MKTREERDGQHADGKAAQENAEFIKVFRLQKPLPRTGYGMHIGVGTSSIVCCLSTMKKYVKIMVYVDGNRELYERLKSHSKEMDRHDGIIDGFL